FVNGAWMQRTEIPADRSSYNAFAELDETAEHNLLAIIEEAIASTDAAEGTDARKVADFYRSFMDSAAVEARDTEPILADLARIDSIRTKTDLARFIADLHTVTTTAPFDFYIDQDKKDARRYEV